MSGLPVAVNDHRSILSAKRQVAAPFKSHPQIAANAAANTDAATINQYFLSEIIAIPFKKGFTTIVPVRCYPMLSLLYLF
jgi:hypothetical protein